MSSRPTSAATATASARRRRPDHVNYSFRTMAQDQVDVMTALGFDRFYLAGHDRGARTAHRMALDHPDRVRQRRPAGHRADAIRLGPHLTRLDPQLLALVVHGAARADVRTHDRGDSGSRIRRPPSRPDRGAVIFRSAGAQRVRPVLHAEDDSRLVRGLPAAATIDLVHDERRSSGRAEAWRADVGLVGTPQRRGHALWRRHPARLARGCRRDHGRPAGDGPLPRRGGPRRSSTRSSASSCRVQPCRCRIFRLARR